VIITTPVSNDIIKGISIFDKIKIFGLLFTGRDAALPRLVELIKKGEILKKGIDLKGSVLFHTAVSAAGIGPTSSNKKEIESSLPILSKAGVKIHIGKGRLSNLTVDFLNESNSIFAICPPVSALLSSVIRMKRVVAFPEEGIEAFHCLEVEGLPALVAIAHGKTIFQ
jgi:fumarate hydratase subunit beta